MKLAIILSVFFCTSAFAATKDIRCVTTFNSDSHFEVNIKLNDGQRNQKFADFDGYEFFLSALKDDMVELQIYNPYDPSRSYASAKLVDQNYLELVIWKRDSILETRCQLK